MPKTQILLILVLIGCVAFISCERVRNIVGVMPDEDAMEPSDMVDQPSDMMEESSDPMEKPGDMIDMADMMNMTDMEDVSMTGPTVVINELMADNDNIIADPQGDYDDWLELFNRTDSTVMLTGMYLSDTEDEPTKWAFPENTEIPANGYLIVWLDDDGEDVPDGLHANFKLSKSGEIAMFVDTDAHGNQVLDSVTFGEQETDTAFGRLPDGTGDFQIVRPTPGAPNMAQ